MTEEIRTTCNRDCPDSCSIIATVENGKIVKHKGDPKHGVTRGFLCYRGNHYLKRFYAQDRILFPQRKTEKGWERISWDDALDLVAKKLSQYRDQYGAKSIAYISYSGIKGQVTRALAKTFWNQFGGATLMKGGLSLEAALAAQDMDFGSDGTHAPEDLVNSNAFVIWGKNVSITRVHAWPFITQARKQGARVVVIDPVSCKTAKQADLHIALKPGSDGMLALGIARLLLENGQIDQKFISDHSKGFEAYRELVLSTPMKDVLDATGVSLNDIQQVALLYGESKPLASLIGLGPSYWRQGGTAVRLIDALAAISGNIGISGGGAHSDFGGGTGLNTSIFDDSQQNEYRSILLPKLGEEILAASNPSIKMGFVAGANPAATCPDTGRVLEGLNSLDFLVVVDHFMTATAEAADLFLPCTTYLEMEDLVTAYGHHWLGLCQAVVPPQGECKSDSTIYQELAQHLGFGEVLAGEPSVLIDRMLAPLKKYGITREKLIEAPMLNPTIDPFPFANKKFGTASGKYEFVTQFIPPKSDTHPQKRLRLLATKTLKMVNAQINLEDLPASPCVLANPGTINDLDLTVGEQVVIESKVGSVHARLEADPNVLPEVLMFNPSAWQGDMQGVNQLRESVISDLGVAAALHETLVTINKI